MTIAKYIKAKRDLHGLTQERLAERLEMSQSTVSRLEVGTDLPTYEQIVKLSRILSGRSLEGEVVDPFNVEQAMRLVISHVDRSMTNKASGGEAA